MVSLALIAQTAHDFVRQNLGLQPETARCAESTSGGFRRQVQVMLRSYGPPVDRITRTGPSR
jgi:hypothetical protein